MPPDSEAARRAGSKGWTVAADYSPVQEVMVALRVAPFDQAGRVTYLEAARQHWKPFLAFVLLFIAVALMAFLLAIKVRDLRRTRRMLQEAVQEQTRLKTEAEGYLNIAAEIILVLDSEGIITLLNRSGHHLLGYEEGTLVGRNWFETCIPEDRRETTREIFRGLKNQKAKSEVFQNEDMVQTRSGEQLTFLWHSTVLVQDGSFRGLLNSGIDITEKRKQREELARSYEALEQAKEAAEASSRAKSEFLSVMSHELRTPLNPILSLSGLLMEMFKNPESIDPDEAREFLGMIEQGGAHLESLLADILDFVQIGSDEYSVEMETVNLSELVEECVNEFRSEAEKKGLRLVYKGAEDASASVQSNRLLILTLVRKLLKNAVDYSEQGEIRVFCNREKDWDCIRVEDDGIGMTGSEIAKIFEPFYQADSSSTRKVDGIGLGLSLVQKIVDTLGGRIEVTSKPGVGSIFTVRLPAKS